MPYRINFEENTIVITKKFAKEASVLNSKAYKTISQMRRDFPTYQIVQKEIRKKKGKRSYSMNTASSARNASRFPHRKIS